MNILLLVASKTNLKMRSQIFFLGFLVLWEIGLVIGVCYEKGVRIGQGLSMLLNPPFNVPFSEPQ